VFLLTWLQISPEICHFADYCRRTAAISAFANLPRGLIVSFASNLGSVHNLVGLGSEHEPIVCSHGYTTGFIP